MQLAAPGPAGRLDHVSRGGCLRVPAGADVVGRQELAEPALAVDHQQAVVGAPLHECPRRLDALISAAEGDLRGHVVAHRALGEAVVRKLADVVGAELQAEEYEDDKA